MKSKTNERAKFMEGATWIAIKSKTEADRISSSLNKIAMKFVSDTE